MTAPDSTMAQISRRMLSAKAEQFTESVIREMTRLAMKHGAVNLSQGFPDFAAPMEIKEAARQAIADDINQYAITWGAKPLRDAVIEKFAHTQGVRYDPEREITVCCGSTEAMMSAMMAIINPGDEIVVFEPFYENYGPDAILSGASPRFVRLRPPEWSFDENELSAAANAAHSQSSRFSDRRRRRAAATGRLHRPALRAKLLRQTRRDLRRQARAHPKNSHRGRFHGFQTARRLLRHDRNFAFCRSR